jgi:hypothetical protein
MNSIFDFEIKSINWKELERIGKDWNQNQDSYKGYNHKMNNFFDYKFQSSN